MAKDVFAVPIFFICFRECIETSIVVSVLLSFLKQTLGGEHDAPTRKRLIRQVWWGVGVGLFISICIGAGMIGAFYGYGKDHFAGAEDLWEGIFSLIASIIIAVMGAALLRVTKLQEKWRVKLAQALETKPLAHGTFKNKLKLWAEKYAMFLLPFITVLREGLEAVVFIGGVSLSFPATAFPLPVFTGVLAGVAVGYLIYRGGNQASLQIFLIISTCFLYLVAAGLFSRGVWYLENNAWNHVSGGDAAETGAGPGSYDIRQSVWHVNCCSPLINGGGGWGIFNAILGWTNSATYGSVISYNLYWLAVIICFIAMRHKERHGSLPLLDPLMNKLKGRKSSQPQTDLQDIEFSAVSGGRENASKVPRNEATLI
ncbi:FTR1 family protein [Aspergillus clavatus NRRL 1]|uniref:High-affinity iron ion transporter FtrA n=1 Tax=Aspergillus clavatus (strain ATCC 1007 / CBS 513.65 / DSM 816 / NCTC 3887 / NRRL 1 / QM 1276 / 107) TaxID=344612 RepID=A1C4V4_ASPCL|nr:high-affinity iron ion transporter FtrA [Aspergillus clavatus NRRL 1]EAW14722.1 high-affinity iron ion transporter FtrA [Aspergillus clavatus NRRL 1]